MKSFVKNMENYENELDEIKSKVNEFAEKFEFIEVSN